MMNSAECSPIKLDIAVREIEPSKSMTRFHMERLLKPLLVCMSVFGLYSSYPEPSGRKCACGRLKIYSVFVFIILCGGVYCSANEYDKGITEANMGPMLGMWVLGLLFYSLNVITAFVLFISCCRKDGLPALLKSWLLIQQSDGHSSNNNRAITKVVYCCVLVSLMYVAFGTVNSAIALFKWGKDLLNAKGIILIIWYCVMEAYHFGVWCLSAALVFVLSFAICMEFKSFKEDFRSQISSDGKFMGDLRKCRRRHQLICSLVEKMDDVVSVIVGCGVFINTIQVLLGLYVNVWNHTISSDPNLKRIMDQWLLASVCILFIFCTSGAFINHMAHAPLSDAYRIDIMDNKEMATELQIFLSRLNGENIGLTVMKMFVVDKSTIRTVCGMLMTYYLVLEQFQSADNSCCANRLNMTGET